MINLLIADLQELPTIKNELLNANKRLTNLNNYLDNQANKIAYKRTYKIKFPLSLFIHKSIIDNVSEPQEIINYDKVVKDYNNELKQYLQLSDKYKSLRFEIKMLAEELTFNDVKKLHLSSKQAKETYRALKKLSI